VLSKKSHTQKIFGRFFGRFLIFHNNPYLEGLSYFFKLFFDILDKKWPVFWPVGNRIPR